MSSHGSSSRRCLTASAHAWKSTMRLNPRLLGAFVLTSYFFARDRVYLNRPGSRVDTIVGSAGEHRCSRSHYEIEGFEHGEFHGTYTVDLTRGCPGHSWLHLSTSLTCQHLAAPCSTRLGLAVA